MENQAGINYQEQLNTVDVKDEQVTMTALPGYEESEIEENCNSINSPIEFRQTVDIYINAEGEGLLRITCYGANDILIIDEEGTSHEL